MAVTGISHNEGYAQALIQSIDEEIDFDLYENDHDTTQLVDLTSSNQSCQNWNNFPIALTHATGAMVSGSPLVCGGWSGLESSGIRRAVHVRPQR